MAILLSSALCLNCGVESDRAANNRTISAAADRPAGPHPRIAVPEEANDWVRAAKDYSSSRYSTLNQITAESVKSLGVRLTFSTGVNAGHEAAPLVVGGTMFIVTPWPNILYALDLTQPGSPVKFAYHSKPLAAARGVACCDVVNRGAAYADGLVFFNTLDNRTIAVAQRQLEQQCVRFHRVGDHGAAHRAPADRCR